MLYLGALGDRYGRKMMLIGGVLLSIPACLLAAYAPTDGVLAAARVLGGLSAGMAFPTTLALITALWSGTIADQVDRGLVGDRRRHLGPRPADRGRPARVLLVGLGVPRHAAARGRGAVMALKFVPSHVNEATDPVDNLGGVLSALMVGALILGINFAAVPDKGTLAIGLGRDCRGGRRRVRDPPDAVRATRSTTSTSPARRIFWVAAVAGIIVFGSLMAAMFIGQQFLQNVLGYDTLEAGAAILPAVILMVIVAPRSAKLDRGPWFEVHPALRLRLLLPRVPRHAHAVGHRQPVLAGRAGVRLRRSRCGTSRAHRRRTR